MKKSFAFLTEGAIIASGRLAQRESTRFTCEGSQVQTLYLPFFYAFFGSLATDGASYGDPDKGSPFFLLLRYNEIIVVIMAVK